MVTWSNFKKKHVKSIMLKIIMFIHHHVKSGPKNPKMVHFPWLFTLQRVFFPMAMAEMKLFQGDLAMALEPQSLAELLAQEAPWPHGHGRISPSKI